MEYMTQEIDPRFFIPPYISGVTYQGTQQPSSDFPQQENETPVLVDYTVEENLDDSYDDADQHQDEQRLLPPDYITVVSQTARVTSGGTVVDVVIDVEDAARVSQFEVRVTK